MNEEIAFFDVSICIPTIGACQDITRKLINSLAPHVREIFLYDNHRMFSNKDFPDNPNVKVTKKKNLFVNLAWNDFSKIASSENLILLNDDVYFPEPEKVLKEIMFELNNLVFCIIGMDEAGMLSMKTVEDIDETLKQDDIYFTKCNEMPRNWGCMIAVKKEHYTYINPELLIWFGDNTLFDITPLKKPHAPNKAKLYCKWYHVGSASHTDTLIKGRHDFEFGLYQRVKELLQERLDERFKTSATS